MKKKLTILFIIIIDLLITYTTYVKVYFPWIDVYELLFCTNGLSSSDFTPIIDAITRVSFFNILVFIILYLLFYKLNIYKYKLSYILISLLTFILILFNFNIFDTLYYELSSSNFIKDNYVDPKKVNIDLKDKKNLIYISLESFESTLMDEKNGGSWNYNLLKDVSLIDKKDYSNIFYNKDNKKGMKMVNGASYTSASIFTNTSSVPFKYSPFKENNNLKKSYTLLDLLNDNGYTNELISSATTSFGNIGDYYKLHGNTNIIDINSYKKYGFKLTNKDLIDWGFNDRYTFEIAKKRLDYLASKDEPFCLSIIGIDTHFPKGYKSFYTSNKYDSQYANVYYSESILISDFIDYISTKDYFKDTVIVILGDHLSMQKDFYESIDDNDRYIYINYINSINPQKNKNRVFTALDTYPSIIGAMGGEIKGNRLGLGTNMFSDELTLAEKYGYSKLNKELKKNSKYYYKYIY